jgi:hypothetical protein
VPLTSWVVLAGISACIAVAVVMVLRNRREITPQTDGQQLVTEIEDHLRREASRYQS